MTQSLNVGLIGLGTVGAQVAERMLTWGPQLSRRAGVELCLQRVLVRDLKKRRAVEIAPELLTTEPADLLEDPAIDVLVEVAGGDEPMRSYLERAISAGNAVPTWMIGGSWIQWRTHLRWSRSCAIARLGATTLGGAFSLGLVSPNMWHLRHCIS